MLFGYRRREIRRNWLADEDRLKPEDCIPSKAEAERIGKRLITEPWFLELQRDFVTGAHDIDDMRALSHRGHRFEEGEGGVWAIYELRWLATIPRN